MLETFPVLLPKGIKKKGNSYIVRRLTFATGNPFSFAVFTRVKNLQQSDDIPEPLHKNI